MPVGPDYYSGRWSWCANWWRDAFLLAVGASPYIAPRERGLTADGFMDSALRMAGFPDS